MTAHYQTMIDTLEEYIQSTQADRDQVQAEKGQVSHSDHAGGQAGRAGRSPAEEAVLDLTPFGRFSVSAWFTALLMGILGIKEWILPDPGEPQS